MKRQGKSRLKLDPSLCNLELFFVRTQKYVRTYVHTYGICLSNYITPNINSVSCSHLQVNPTDCKDFADALQRSVRVCRAKTSRGWRAINADALAEKWMVSPEIARRTLSRTTRRGIRTTSHSSMSRRFRTNDRHMRYKRLRHNLYRHHEGQYTISVEGLVRTSFHD